MLLPTLGAWVGTGDVSAVAALEVTAGTDGTAVAGGCNEGVPVGKPDALGLALAPPKVAVSPA
jgi:hypothetical protein